MQNTQAMNTTLHIQHTDRCTLSIICPMCNEEESLEIFFGRLLPVLQGTGETFEIVCVNDGSRDIGSANKYSNLNRFVLYSRHGTDRYQKTQP